METALLKVMNNVLLKMNLQHVTLLILLDLSAAFDTVDHSILFDWLTKVFGLQVKGMTIDASLSMDFWTAVFPRDPAWVHCCSLFSSLPSLRALKVTLLKSTAMPMTPDSTSASGQPRILGIALWKYALRTFKSGSLMGGCY